MRLYLAVNFIKADNVPKLECGIRCCDRSNGRRAAKKPHRIISIAEAANIHLKRIFMRKPSHIQGPASIEHCL